ncbi:dienelactone hydrolase [Mycobacterium sp. 1554424.7]|nr:dienelactone hydrolase [Mycobacterium sp. 1554424.7]
MGDSWQLADNAAPESDLSGWECAPFSALGFTYDVYRKGAGPSVVLIPEMPGLDPVSLGLGNHLVDNGFTVAAPSLFGEPGVHMTSGDAVVMMARACVAREFAAFAINANRPVAQYLRALARDLNHETPGRGVGVIGQCFTGGFALAAAGDDSVLAPVLAQPSLPIPITASRRRDPGLSNHELAAVERRVAEEGLCALGLRFTNDWWVPVERFKTLKDRLGEAFEVIEIESHEGNDHGFKSSAHSVVTRELREREGHPAFEARQRIVAYLNERLKP